MCFLAGEIIYRWGIVHSFHSHVRLLDDKWIGDTLPKIQHTYIVSPVDMAGLIGMAQTLAVFHYGYHTLKRREVQFHGTAQIPTDAAAMLDWGLDTPFMSQDRPPLAIAMTATVDGIRGIRRYRLVVAQKAKLRLSPEVSTALASRTADHRLTASGFFPCSIDREFLYGYAADGYRSPLWICAAYDGDDEADSDDQKGCPPNPTAQEHPPQDQLDGAAEKLDTMMAKVQPPLNIFFTPENLGALPALWLQAKLTISLAPFQEKFAKLFQTIAGAMAKRAVHFFFPLVWPITL
jgi:hypothetical protein